MAGFGSSSYGYSPYGYGLIQITLATPGDPLSQTVLWPNLGNDLLLDDEMDLVVQNNGFALTNNGLTTLKQDMQSTYNLIPGDLFNHPNVGNSGIKLWGENYSKEWVNEMLGALDDCAKYNSSIYSRLKTETIDIKESSNSTERQPKFLTSATTIAEDETTLENLVWGSDLDDITKI